MNNINYYIIMLTHNAHNRKRLENKAKPETPVPSPRGFSSQAPAPRPPPARWSTCSPRCSKTLQEFPKKYDTRTINVFLILEK